MNVKLVGKAMAVATATVIIGGTVASAQSDAGPRLDYDKKANRFTWGADAAAICERLGQGRSLTPDGSGCAYTPATLDFLAGLGFSGDAAGFTVADPAGDVWVFTQGRPADKPRYDATGLDWALIEADEALLQAAVTAEGAVAGDAVDLEPGPRVAMFLHLDEPPIWDGDSISLNVNTSLDDEVVDDIVRRLDPSFPTGGGDTNISLGWAYPEGEDTRNPEVVPWSGTVGGLLPGNAVAGPSEDPSGVWAIIGSELMGGRFNVEIMSDPLYSPAFIDRVEGDRGAYASFELDGESQAYFDGFTLEGTANAPGPDFQLVFHTPFAPLFKGGTAKVGYLMGDQVDRFPAEITTTASTIELGLSLPTGPTGITSIKLVPSGKAKVAVANQKKPVAVKRWLKGKQLTEINAALNEIMALSLAPRFELSAGQEVSLGAGPT